MGSSGCHCYGDSSRPSEDKVRYKMHHKSVHQHRSAQKCRTCSHPLIEGPSDQKPSWSRDYASHSPDWGRLILEQIREKIITMDFSPWGTPLLGKFSFRRNIRGYQAEKSHLTYGVFRRRTSSAAPRPRRRGRYSATRSC
jgi:hypothetical protein